MVLSASPSQHVWLQCGVQIAWLTEPLCFLAQGGDLEYNVASHGKPMKITKEIGGVLLTLCNLCDFSVASCNSALQ